MEYRIPGFMTQTNWMDDLTTADRAHLKRGGRIECHRTPDGRTDKRYVDARGVAKNTTTTTRPIRRRPLSRAELDAIRLKNEAMMTITRTDERLVVADNERFVKDVDAKLATLRAIRRGRGY